VSYNVKKLAEHGYIAQVRSAYDRRSVHVRLTKKGLNLRDRLQGMHHRHVEMLNQTAIITEDNLQATTATLRQLERQWISVSEPHIAAA